MSETETIFRNLAIFIVVIIWGAILISHFVILADNRESAYERGVLGAGKVYLNLKNGKVDPPLNWEEFMELAKKEVPVK